MSILVDVYICPDNTRLNGRLSATAPSALLALHAFCVK